MKNFKMVAAEHYGEQGSCVTNYVGDMPMKLTACLPATEFLSFL